VGAPPCNRAAAVPLSFAQGRRSQSDGRPRRDGWNLPTYASAGLDTSFAAFAGLVIQPTIDAAQRLRLSVWHADTEPAPATADDKPPPDNDVKDHGL
jgi:hypothetical protein